MSFSIPPLQTRKHTRSGCSLIPLDPVSESSDTDSSSSRLTPPITTADGTSNISIQKTLKRHQTQNKSDVSYQTDLESLKRSVSLEPYVSFQHYAFQPVKNNYYQSPRSLVQTFGGSNASLATPADSRRPLWRASGRSLVSARTISSSRDSFMSVYSRHQQDTPQLCSRASRHYGSSYSLPTSKKQCNLSFPFSGSKEVGRCQTCQSGTPAVISSPKNSELRETSENSVPPSRNIAQRQSQTPTASSPLEDELASFSDITSFSSKERDLAGDLSYNLDQSESSSVCSDAAVDMNIADECPEEHVIPTSIKRPMSLDRATFNMQLIPIEESYLY